MSFFQRTVPQPLPTFHHDMPKATPIESPLRSSARRILIAAQCDVDPRLWTYSDAELVRRVLTDHYNRVVSCARSNELYESLEGQWCFVFGRDDGAFCLLCSKVMTATNGLYKHLNTDMHRLALSALTGVDFPVKVWKCSGCRNLFCNRYTVVSGHVCTGTLNPSPKFPKSTPYVVGIYAPTKVKHDARSLVMGSSSSGKVFAGIGSAYDLSDILQAHQYFTGSQHPQPHGVQVLQRDRPQAQAAVPPLFPAMPAVFSEPRPHALTVDDLPASSKYGLGDVPTEPQPPQTFEEMLATIRDFPDVFPENSAAI